MENFEACGFAATRSYDSSALTNHPYASALVARSVKGGELECALNQQFPGAGRGVSVTCGSEQLVYSDLLATGEALRSVGRANFASRAALPMCLLQGAS